MESGTTALVSAICIFQIWTSCSIYHKNDETEVSHDSKIEKASHIHLHMMLFDPATAVWERANENASKMPPICLINETRRCQEPCSFGGTSLCLHINLLSCDDLRMPTRYKMSNSVCQLPHIQSDSSQLNRKCNDSDILTVFAGRKDEDLDAIVRAILAWE